MTSQRLTRRSFLEKNVMVTAGVGLGGAALGGVAAAAEQPIIPVELAPGEKLRVGILGCGNRSRDHIAAANHYAEQMEIWALCDLLPEMLEEKRQLVKTGKPTLYKDYEEMMKDDQLQAVIVVLPNTLHRDGVIAALEAGKHVLCEKPLTIDVSQTKEIIAASERTRRIVQVGTQSRHSPGYAALAAQLEDGLIGSVLYGWAQTFRADWRKLDPDPETDARINWRMKQAEGGSVVYEMGIHTIDVFNWFIGSDVEEVSCFGGTHNKKLEKRDSWDHAGVIARYTNGAMMTYGGNLYSCGGAGPDVLYGDGGSLRIGTRYSDQAMLYKSAYWRPYGGAESPEITEQELTLPKDDATPSVLQYAHFLEAVQGKAPAFPTARQHLPAVQIARGSLLSAAEHRHVKAAEIP